MRMMNELKHLFLYSANKKVYAPIDEKDKKRNAAILLLTSRLEDSIRLMNLPYVYNPNLFTSFFVDRNVMAYINSDGVANLDFDEQEEEKLSESMTSIWNSKCEFKFDDKASIVDQSYIRDVYNKKTTDRLRTMLGLKKIPDKIKVVVHPTETKLKDSAPKRVFNVFKGKMYSYSYNGEIHVLSKYVYDQNRMCGPYELYLEAELFACILCMYNEELPLVAVKGIALVLSGAYQWIKDNKTDIDDELPEWKFAKTTYNMIKKDGIKALERYIITGDIYIYTKFNTKTAFTGLQGLIFEETLSYFDRQRLLPSEFGIPNKRAYPMPDEDHVRAAVRMFNNCDPDDEKELAQSIIKKMKKFGITDIRVGATNRFRKYYNPESKRETALLETNISSSLDDEFKKRTYISLSSFEADNLNANKPHEEFARELRHVRINNKSFGEIFVDKNTGELACFYMTEEKDDGVVWITALEIAKEFQGHGLSRQLLMRIFDFQNATHLSVNKKNKVAIKIYERDFEVYDETDSIFFMRLKGYKPHNGSFKYDFSNMSKDVHTIIDSLSKEDANHIGNGYWVDSDHVIFRDVEYRNGKPVGFIDVYLLPRYKRTGLVVLAVSDGYKHQGIGKSLANKAKQMLRSNDDIDKLRWLTDSDNEASISMAKSLGFKLNKDGQTEKEFIFEATLINGDLKTDDDLLKWMQKNIRYVNFTKLKSAEEVFDSKTGSCHDQVMYELNELRKLGYKNVQVWFIMECTDQGQGGETHSAVTYEKDGKTYYFENAWSKNAGIHELKDSVEKLFYWYHKNGKWGNIKEYENIGVSRFNGKPGMSLQDLVNSSETVTESMVLNELATIPDNKIVVGTDFHFVGYDDEQQDIILKPDSYINNIIKKQNELVGNDGVFIFLGDLLYKGFHSEFEIPANMKKKVIPLIKKFKGKYKVLIRGNHDNLPDKFYIETLGFTHVCSSLTYGNIVFTHQPEIVNDPKVNIHGHIHGARTYIEKNPTNYADVYAIGGEKLRMATLPDILEKQKEYEETIKQGTNINKVDPHLFIDGEKLELDKIVTESFANSDYEDILKICSHLSSEELARITFYDTYRNSQFVIKRIIHYEGGEPVGFLDVYQFPSKSEIAQIVIAVDNRYHGQGIGNEMTTELMNSGLENNHDFEMYYWTAHPENQASQNLALKHGFQDACYMDKYGRIVFTKRVRPHKGLWEEIPEYMRPITGQEDCYVDECAFITESFAFFNEADDKYSDRLRRYLYKERIKNNKGTLEIYDRVKASGLNIRKMYLKIEMYKKYNLFIDLSYYHSIFLENNLLKLDKAVNFYFDFLNRLINNPEIDKEYKKKTIFIPIDAGTWPVKPGTDITDYKSNLNPISIIVRLIRTNPGLLKKAWGNKDIVFVGSRGYFKIDFNKFELKNITRLKSNLRKLMSSTEPVEDEYEADELGSDSEDNISAKNVDSKKAMAAKMIDKIETGTSIKIDDVSAAVITPENVEKKLESFVDHLRLNPTLIPVDGQIKEDFGVAVVVIDPEGPDGYEKIKGIETYCMPK